MCSLLQPNLSADALLDPCVHRPPLPLACRLRPNMAHHFPFELDTFQKEAICHLEQVRTRQQRCLASSRRGGTCACNTTALFHLYN